MPIDVYCNCGNALSVSVDLAGRKIRCKKCNEVLKIPSVPMDQSAEMASGPDEYEVVSEETTSRTCPECGATASSEDNACLACGADLSQGALGFLDKVPPQAIIGGGVLLLVIILWVVISNVMESMAPDNHVANGNEYLAQEDYVSAEKEYREALSYEKNHPGAVVGLANIGVRANKPNLLQQFAREALKPGNIKDPGERARLRIAWAWVLLPENHLEANNQAIEAKAEDPNVAGLHAILGLAALKLTPPNEEEAVKELQLAVDKDSKRRQVYEELARLYKKKKKYTEGAAVAQKATTLEDAGKDAQVWLLVGELKDLAGDRDGMVKALNKAAELDDKNASVHARLSQVYHDAWKKKQVETGENDRALLDDALKAARKAADLDSANTEAHVAVGRILLAQGKPVQAKAALTPEKAGTGWQANFLYGRALVDTGDVNGGLRRIRTALKARPDDLALHLEAGQIMVDAKQSNTAVNFLKKLVQDNRDSYEARILVAHSMTRSPSGDRTHDLAIREHLGEAIKIDERSGSKLRRAAPLALGLHLLRRVDEAREEHIKGLYLEAITAFALGAKHLPKDLELQYYLGYASFKASERPHRAKRWDQSIAALTVVCETLNKKDYAGIGGSEDPGSGDLARDLLQDAKQEREYEKNNQ